MIFIGGDHAGFELKGKIIEYLKEKNIEVEDEGTYSEESVDYPDFAKKVAEKVLNNENALGILICGTGIGISMAANKVSGIRAALCTNETMAEYARKHNNANVLCIGARIIGEELARSIVNTFLSNEFEGGRHTKRVQKIIDIED